MHTQAITPELTRWIVDQAAAGRPAEAILQPLLEAGWEQDTAADAVATALERVVAEHARENGLPLPVPVPVPLGFNGCSELEVDGRRVQVLGNLQVPRLVVFGGLLSAGECDALVESARSRLKPSATFNAETGEDELHASRTSQGIHLPSGGDALLARVERRIATLLDWPLENGETLQVLHYGPAAEYRPHYDWFDPDAPGADAALSRGGQRVASLVMYLNTPARGGSTSFPDVGFEVPAVKGNAVFFSYDRPHAMTRTLHAGSPVLEGEKWVATKWLRERPFR
ncbi:2OG-Fe(II) oxygenase [Lysobacter sp. GX 14042]|uniref:2OG-Fe(II) oxygenase n=1 Tax=Lysobacter sp. GX 14042 TaxID=2907155 RepID=UPI001F37ADC9|nr:2OG-Fe(II) oxygenase [Lysobacter sp. GX 14042]MCE7033212.1 2OG-Fe(II) oxygenase [Lysobacter sp. GX 14042]